MTFAGEFLGLPGLRGYWPMGAFDSSGNAIDQSGNARTLTYNGGGTGPLYNYHASGGPYSDYDGTGDYHSRTDEAGLDILGTESYVATAQRGLTVGGWFWSDSIATQYALVGKFLTTGNQRSCWVQFLASQLVFAVSSDGTAATTVTHTTTLSTGVWYFCAARFTPSTELAAIVNNVVVTNTTSIPASIFNSTADFTIGAFSGGLLPLNGRAGNVFVSTMLLSNTALSNLYNNTKASYGL